MALNAINLSRVLLFVALSLPLIWVSRRSLKNHTSHGFYRFFIFEGILVLLMINGRHWFDKPLGFHQMISLVLLFASIALVMSGFRQLRKSGGRRNKQITPENFTFENTGRLVTTGIYCRIRHPMYGSLLLLAWGIFLKRISIVSISVICITTILVIVASKVEELENIYVFGTDYEAYIKRSKRFIPFLW